MGIVSKKDLYCIIGNLRGVRVGGHVSSTTLNDARDVPESGADRHTDNVPEYQPRTIDLSVSGRTRQL